MADTDVWDVVIEEPVDGADPGGAIDRIAIVKKTEVEARQAFAEAVSIAAKHGYRRIELQRNGVAAERWPSGGLTWRPCREWQRTVSISTARFQPLGNAYVQHRQNGAA